jgi:rhomboid protease GluP
MDPDVAIRFGALLPAEAAGGGWWRLIAASFLHFGVLHLAMNMLALQVLGPFVERVLLRWRYIALYLGAGIGSMGAVVLLRQAGFLNYDMLVGASGSIMGLVGATAAIAVGDSRIFKTRASATLLRRAAVLIVIQIIFDASTPQVSMAAHLGGLVSGFLLALLLNIGR